jgi:hypothetical protein
MSFAVNATSAADYTSTLSTKPAGDNQVSLTTETADGAAGFAGDDNQTVSTAATTFTAHGMTLDMSKLASNGLDPAKVKARLNDLAASGEKVAIGYDGAASVTKDSDGNFTITTFDVINGFAGESYEEAESLTVNAQALDAGTLSPKLKNVLGDLMPADPKPVTTGNEAPQEAFTWGAQGQ